MKTLTPWRRTSAGIAATMTASIALGAVGAVVAYRSVAGAGREPTAGAVITSTAGGETSPDAVAAARPVVRFAPCTPPAVLEGRACVTEVVRDVVLPAPSTSGRAGTGEDRRSGRRAAASDRDDPGEGGDDRDDRDDRDDGRGGDEHEDEDHEDDHEDDHDD